MSRSRSASRAAASIVERRTSVEVHPADLGATIAWRRSDDRSSSASILMDFTREMSIEPDERSIAAHAIEMVSLPPCRATSSSRTVTSTRGAITIPRLRSGSSGAVVCCGCPDPALSSRRGVPPRSRLDGTTTVVRCSPPGIDPLVQSFSPSWVNIGADVPPERSSSGRRARSRS